MPFTFESVDNAFTHERDQPYDEHPPPYTESATTTQVQNPGFPVAAEDVAEEQTRLRETRNKSKPLYQFKSQAKREEERLHDQLIQELHGRRRTLPFDETTGYKSNAENNVRARWVEQGIWGEEWGPAWPQGSRLLGIASRPPPNCDGPFFSQATPDFPPGLRWGHEQGDTPSPSPSPPPRIPDTLISVPRSSPPPHLAPPTQPRPRFQIARVLPDDSIVAKVPKPTVRNSEASRPVPQFVCQVAKEREWLQDEAEYNTQGRAVDLDSLAYQSVKNHWIKDGIWSPKWTGELPGSSWYHEEPESYGPIDHQRAAPAWWTEVNQRPLNLTAREYLQQTRRRRNASASPAVDQNHLPVPKPAFEDSNHATSSTSNEVPNDEADAPHPQQVGTRRSARIANRQAQAAAAAAVAAVTPTASTGSKPEAAKNRQNYM